MYDEDDLLPLSGLQHLAFCARQWGLIHVETYWSENRLTVEGRHLHERVHQPAVETRGDVRIVRGLRLHSLQLGIVGQADVVEFHRIGGQGGAPALGSDSSGPNSASFGFSGPETPALGVDGIPIPRVQGRWRPSPVEYKRGRPKPGDCDRVQLCAQALCLEEMLGVSVPAGELFYGKTRRRQDVSFDATLRQRTVALAATMHELFTAGVTPRVAYDRRRCDRCSLYDRCLPKTTGASPDVRRYLASSLQTEGMD